MSVTISGLDTIAHRVAAARALPEKAIGRLAAMASDMVKQHTLAGKDENGTAFAPYSRAYLSRMVKKGRKQAEQHVDLFDTGNMFRAMQWQQDAGLPSGYLFFTRAEENEKAAWHHLGLGSNPKRAFFGIQPDEERRLSVYLAKMYKESVG